METSRRKALGRGLEELFNNEPMDYEKIEEKIIEESNNEEIVIIGGGLSGLTTAYYLSKAGKKVVLLEKDKICNHTSGNTTAKITSQHGLIYTYLINTYGEQFAKDYLFANEEAIKNIKKIIDTENIDCEFEKQSNFVYTTDKLEINKIKKD